MEIEESVGVGAKRSKKGIHLINNAWNEVSLEILSVKTVRENTQSSKRV